METEGRTVRKSWYQCNNMECGVSFTTLEGFHEFVRKRKTKTKDESESIPWEDFPKSHRGRNQLNLDLDQKDETDANNNHP